MQKSKKWIAPALLLVLVTLVFSYGSFAAYAKSYSGASGAVSAKDFTFFVNDSATQRQDLGDVTLAVGQSQDYTIRLDGRSSEAPVDAVVTLNYDYEGTWPTGLVVLCDGQSVNSGDSRNFYQLQSTGAVQSLTYTVVWNNPNLGNYEAFRGFTLHLTVTVNAVQSA